MHFLSRNSTRGSRMHSTRGRARRGISLLEVLISMFVLLIGLMGVAALIPLARFEVLEGAKADRGVTQARAALHDSKIRGIWRPLQLYSASGTQTFVQMWLNSSGAAAWTPAGISMPFDTSNTTPSIAAGQYGYAIDPLSIAVNGATVATFPAKPISGNPSMVRVTLRSTAANSATAMNYQTADLIFHGQDDLIFNKPTTSGDFAPSQAVQFPMAAKSKRTSGGDYSWLATVVPANGVLGGGDPLLCRVSVVVFYKRNLIFTAGSAAVPPTERMVSITAGAVGIGGGEVQLSTTGASSANANWLDLKPNQWILLSQPAFPSSSPTVAPWYRWYKVLATDTTQGTGPWTRNVTLQGPDWIPGSPAGATFASIFDDVIGVYEREIELEEAGSEWSPN